MAYRDFKDLKRRTASDKILREKAFNIVYRLILFKPKLDGYQRGLASMVYKFFDKTSTRSGVANNEIKQNLQLANIWGADLADMQLISKFNKGFRFLLCVIDIFSKYSRVVPLKDKKGISIVNGFQKILKESNRIQAKSKVRKT